MRVYWIDEIIQYIEEKVVDYLLENSVRRQINKVERKIITKKYQKDLEENRFMINYVKCCLKITL